MVFAVIGVGNFNIDDTAFKAFYDEAKENDELDDAPNVEYEKIGLLFGYILSTLRLSLGDFDFGASIYLTTEENILYWIIWFIVILLTCIVFLNFIIAEASASYENVK